MLKSVLAEHLDEQLVTYIRDQSCIIHQIDTLRHFDKYESADEMLAIWGNMTTVLKVRPHQTQHQQPTQYSIVCVCGVCVCVYSDRPRSRAS
jgi:hypothetical protein